MVRYQKIHWMLVEVKVSIKPWLARIAMSLGDLEPVMSRKRKWQLSWHYSPEIDPRPKRRNNHNRRCPAVRIVWKASLFNHHQKARRAPWSKYPSAIQTPTTFHCYRDQKDQNLSSINPTIFSRINQNNHHFSNRSSQPEKVKKWEKVKKSALNLVTLAEVVEKVHCFMIQSRLRAHRKPQMMKTWCWDSH